MIVLLALLITTWVLWRVRKARRAQMLAGLDSTRPTFTVEPPSRRGRRVSKDVL